VALAELLGLVGLVAPAAEVPDEGVPDAGARGAPRLLDPVTLAGRTAPSRVIFGPHETNLGRGRALSARHTAYYERRAAGGAGLIITEIASVHESDWPYERAPLAVDCADGWREIVAACRPHGALVLAGLGHTGLQGSSAYSQQVLWGPSGFTDAVSRETPMIMEEPELAALVAGFAAAAAAAAAAGLDGVELDAGPGALLRQFHSGLTSQRADRYGTDRLALTREVLAAVRAAIGPGLILALRLSCDELAPWAGVTPEQAADQAAALAPDLDLLTVVRGGPYSASAYRPDAHTPPMFNQDLAAAIRAAVAGAVPVALQGSVVDAGAAQAALDAGAADLAEMTRAQIADADLVAKLRGGRPDRIRPCILCNQTCRVRDNRNPMITCIADPRTGHETTDPPAIADALAAGVPAEGAPAAGVLAPVAPALAPQPVPPATGQNGTSRSDRGEAGELELEPGLAAAGGLGSAPDVLVVGGGPAGLEAARVAAGEGLAVRLAERSGVLGGTLRAAAAGQARERMALLADWLEAEARRLGVRIDLGAEITAGDLDVAAAAGTQVILATGSRPVARFDPAISVDALAVLSGAAQPAETREQPGNQAAGAGEAPDTTALSSAAPSRSELKIPFRSGGEDPDGVGGAEGPGVAGSSGQVSGLEVAGPAEESIGAGDPVTGPADAVMLPDGPVVVHDPVGGPIGVAVAELLAAAGRKVAFVTQDPVAGTLLSLTGDLADANVRLQRAGVTRELRSLLREVSGGTALLEDVWTGAQRRVDCAVLVDCGHRLPEETLYLARPGTPRAGDCVAPRTVAEAIREGRRLGQAAARRRPADRTALIR
jgi:2,4-dienoyl-CoA reductase-like NADH-dependent reductase (Old Yellow Enzyme family)